MRRIVGITLSVIVIMAFTMGTVGVVSANGQSASDSTDTDHNAQQVNQNTKTTKPAKKTPKGIEKAKTKVPSFVKDKLDIKFPGSGDGDTGGGGNDPGDGISG